MANIETVVKFENIETTENDYDNLYAAFNTYNMTELLNLCEKHKLSIYGNREIIVDRLSYYFSEGRRKNSLKYRIRECYHSIIRKIYGDYTEI
jgi:hypothetical protein